MICNNWVFADIRCEGKIRGYKFDQWPAPVTLCERHFKMSTKETTTIKGTFATKSEKNKFEEMK